MENKLSTVASESKDGKCTYTKRYEEDGLSKCITVEEVENGFVVRVSEYGYKKNGKEGKEEYIDINKTFISKTNPLAEEETKSYKEELIETLANLKI